MAEFCVSCGRPRVIREHGRCLYCGELMPPRHSEGRRWAPQPTSLALFRQRLVAERSRLRELDLSRVDRRPIPRAAALAAMGVLLVGATLASKGLWMARPGPPATSALFQQPLAAGGTPGGGGMAAGLGTLKEPRSAQEALLRVSAALELYARQFGRYPEELSADLGELGRFGNMRALLSFFQGNRIQSYRRSVSPERQAESYLLQAIAGDQDGTLLTAASTFSRQAGLHRAPAP